MRLLDPDRLHEAGDVVREEFGRIGPVRLVALARATRIERDAGEMLGVVGDLKRVTGVVGGEIGDEHQGLARSLLVVVDRDVVDLDLGHRGLPDTPRLDATALTRRLRSSVRQGQRVAGFAWAGTPT